MILNLGRFNYAMIKITYRRHQEGGIVIPDSWNQTVDRHCPFEQRSQARKQPSGWIRLKLQVTHESFEPVAGGDLLTIMIKRDRGC